MYKQRDEKMIDHHLEMDKIKTKIKLVNELWLGLYVIVMSIIFIFTKVDITLIQNKLDYGLIFLMALNMVIMQLIESFSIFRQIKDYEKEEVVRRMEMGSMRKSI